MMRKIIEKKILPKYFDAVIRDKKKFEIRKDEDDLQIGDAVILKEWDGEKYTGREVGRNIVYILRDVPEYGLLHGKIEERRFTRSFWCPQIDIHKRKPCPNCKYKLYR